MEIKWTDRQYHIQYNSDVAHQYVKMYCNKNQFLELPFGGPHSKPHTCAIIRIPRACVACTPMLDKPWISGIPPYEQERYKTATKCTYWPVLGPFNNWNIIKLSQKSTPFDAFDEIYQVVLDGISDNMA